MSIRDSDKLRVASRSLLALLAVYIGVTGALGTIAQRVESRGGIYPYKQEDWLRYLLPTIYAPNGRDRLFLTGPSTARENMLVEVFADSFPEYDALQGALSLGTLDDVVLSLSYLEQVYGDESLPTVLVMGVSPRFIAGIPDERPFEIGLHRYSGHFRFAPDSDGAPQLVAKSFWDGLASRFRFQTSKQAARYKVAVLAVMRPFVPRALRRPREETNRVAGGLVDRILRLAFGNAVVTYGTDALITEWVSPYKYRRAERWSRTTGEAVMDDPDSWWQDVHAWDPTSNEDAIRRRLGQLLEMVERHGIELYVVNLPEREVSRRRYDEGNYARYLALVRDALGDTTPFLDLRDALENDEFYDLEHATVDGAGHVTREVIAFIRS